MAPAPAMLPAVATAPTRPSSVPSWPGLARATVSESAMGIMRCCPALATTIMATVAPKFPLNTAMPTRPAQKTAAAAAPTCVRGSMHSSPVIPATSRPGSSRGNSSRPRTTSETS